jgi:basic amino acid/polyamine antiporter, APA family
VKKTTNGDSPNGSALPRSMGPALATSVVVANVIGVGIFTTSGVLAGMLGDPRLLLGIWVLGGALALAGAFCYAELGARFPRAGGEYVFLREAYGPLVSFLSGWSSLFAGFSAPIAAAALGFTEYLSFYFPALSTQDPTKGLFAPGRWVALLIIITLSAIHYRKVQVGGSIHLTLTAFKVGIISIFILCGFLLGKGTFSHFAGIIPTANWGHVAPAVASGLIFVMFSYSGWNAAAYIGGEIKDPRRNIPRSLLYGTAAVVILYFAINALYLYGIALPQMANDNDRIRIAELASLNLFGLNVAPYLNLIFMGTILSSISAMIIAGPRVYYAMAEDGLFPRKLASVHPTFGTPGNAIILQGVWSVLLLFTGRFEQLLIRSGVILIIFSALTVGAVYVIRRKDKWRDRPYSAWAYPLTPTLFIAASVWILVGSFSNQLGDSLWSLGIVASGVPFYLYWNAKRRRDQVDQLSGEVSE